MGAFVPLGQGLADLLLGVACAGCESPGLGWCPACDHLLTAASPTVRTTALGGGAPVPVAAVAGYSGPVRRALLAHKDHGRWGLARPLGHSLVPAVERVVGRSGSLVLVPVPSSRRRARRRGYDHALALARNAAAGLAAGGAPAAALGLLRLASVSRQVGLGRSARLTNRSGQMTLSRPRARDQLAVTLRGTRIVVVDDIATTGATLDEAVRVLRSAGLEPCGAAVVARVEGLPAVSGSGPSD